MKFDRKLQPSIENMDLLYSDEKKYTFQDKGRHWFCMKIIIIDTPVDDYPVQIDPKNTNEVGKGSRTLAQLEMTIAANIRKERFDPPGN